LARIEQIRLDSPETSTDNPPAPAEAGPEPEASVGGVASAAEDRAGTARYAGGRRIVFLDCVRGVAASIVVVEHFFGLHGQRAVGAGAGPGSYSRWSVEYLSLGRIGVVAFFLVSGYVIPLSLERQTQRTFWVRRFFRLYPVYWVALAAYLIFAWDNASDAGSVTVLGVLAGLLMIQGAIGVTSILPPGWTLGIELVFYGQSAVAAARRWLNRAMHLGWFWLGCFFLQSLGSHVSGHDLHPTLALLLFTASLGHALHLRDQEGSRAWRWLFAAGAILVPIGSVLGQGRTPASQWGWQPLSYGLSWFVGVGLFCAFYALRDRDFGRVLTWLGMISYSVYLTHPTVFALAASIWGRTSLTTLLVAFPAVVLVSWALFITVERPSIEIGRRFSRRARPAPPAVPPPQETAVATTIEA
jgi:peptidoglycan/LPS O-acetylase OafA/YrhL